MHYKIYIPGCVGYSPDHLRRVGLGELLDVDCPVSGADVSGGPDQGRGVVFHWGDHPQPGYHKESEMWTACKARGELPAGRFWMGRSINAPIDPEDLLRGNHVGGEPAELADGRKWLIPIARAMPSKWTEDEQGVPRRRVRPEYEGFVARAQEYFALMMKWREEGGKNDLNVPDAWVFAIQALQINYRVSREIVDWLGLLDDLAIIRLIGATFEWEKYIDLNEKKKRTGELMGAF